MSKKLAIILGVIVIIIAAIIIIGRLKDFGSENNIAGNNVNLVADQNETVKEFTMTSFTEIIDGKYFPQFSSKEITVKKGDRVRIKITTTKGMHDFKIDEFNVYSETPLNQEVVIEFTADKVGDFVYYCTKPGHRQNGHWGTLKVIE